MREAPSARPEELTNAMINHDEERRLREIEQSLEHDDPEFTARIRAIETSATPRFARYATRIAVAGGVLTVVGFLAGSPLGAVGVLLAVVGCSLRLAVTAFTPTVPPCGDDGPGTGATTHGPDRPH